MILGPMSGGGPVLQVTRKIFVPADGRFARYLDTVSNPTGFPLTATVRLSSELMGQTLLQMIEPSASSGGSAVFHGETGSYGASGYVFSGPNPPSLPARIFYGQTTFHSQALQYEWNVTVPPNASVGVLHFLLQDLPDRIAAVRDRAAALVDLSDPEALAGLTDEDLGRIVNYRAPGAYVVTLRGTLVGADGQTPVPDRVVEIYQERGNVFLTAVTSQPDTGAFTAENLEVRGGALLLRTIGAGGGLIEMRVPVNGPGDVFATLVTDSLHGQVRGSVRIFGGGGGLVNGPFLVELRRLNGTVIESTTLVNGQFHFGPNMYPGEGMKVRVFVPGLPEGFLETQTDPVAEGGFDVVADFTLPESIYATVYGRVRALNHDESIEGATVMLLREGTREPITQANAMTDRDGLFTIHVALPAAGEPLTAPFIIRTESPTGSGTGVDVHVMADVQDAWVQPDEIALAISTIAGQLRFGDGADVPFPTLVATGADGVATFATRTRADGTFAFYELPSGSYRITGQDPGSGLTAEFSNPVELPTGTSNAWSIDFSLPPTGTVVVTAVDDTGAPVTDATLALMGDAMAFDRRVGPDDVVKPDAQGRYTFERVPLGDFYVQGRRTTCPGATCRVLFASAAGSLASTADPHEMQVAFAGYGHVRVSLPGSGSGNTLFVLDGLGSSGPLGSYGDAYQVQADSWLFDMVPPGPVAVLVQRDGQIGLVRGSLDSGGEVGFDVELGSGLEFPADGIIDEWGNDGAHYRLDRSGRVVSGGYPLQAPQLADTIANAAALHLGDNHVCCSRAAGVQTDLGGTQYTFGPLAPSFARGLVVTRKVFVPDVGGFARYHDMIANPTDVPVTLTVGVRSDIVGSAAGERGVAARVNPTGVTGGYVAVGAGGTGKYGESAYVFSGANPELYPSLVAFDFTRTDVARYEWRMTIAPHSEVALLHFVLQRLPGDQAGLLERAETLAGAADSWMMFNGLTDTDISAIVNYRIAGTSGVRVEGALLASDGTSTVGGQRVEIIDTADGRLLRTVFTDGSGHYLADRLFVQGGLKVRAFVAGLPGGSTESPEMPVSESNRDLVVDVTLPPSVLTHVEGIVIATDAAQSHDEAIEGAVVTVLHPETGAVMAQTTAGRHGGFSLFLALPESGLATLRAESPTGSGTSVSVPIENHEQHGVVVNNDGLVLPISVLIGGVFNADGSGVPNPTVFARHSDGTTTFAHVSRHDGSFLIYEQPAGNYRLTAQDPATGITADLGRTVVLASNLSHVWYNDVGLPATGTVVVSVTDETGAPVSAAVLALTSDNLAFERRVGPSEVVKPTAGGQYVFNSVPVGHVTLQGKLVTCDIDNNCRERFAAASGTLQAAAGQLAVPMSFSGYGQVRVNVIFPQSGPTLFVLDAQGAAGPLGAWSAAVQMEATSFLFDNVPPGPVRATIRQNQDVGVFDGVLARNAQEPLDVSVYNNSATEFKPDGVTNLDDADGFRYGILRSGDIAYGGVSDGAAAHLLRGTLSNAAELFLDDRPVCCVSAARWDTEWRQLIYGPMAPDFARGLAFTRKVYVSPATQGRSYARYLDIVTNPTDVPITVTLSLRATIPGGGAGARAVVPGGFSPMAEGYAVLNGVPDVYGASAYVFGGVAQDRAQPVAVSFDFSRTEVARHEWRVTIGANSSVGLLHFVTQGLPVDVDGVRSIAVDLLNLVEFNVLAGLSSDDRQSIINFSVAPGLP